MLERSGARAGEYLEVSKTTTDSEETLQLNKTEFSAERLAGTETAPVGVPYGNGKPRRVVVRGKISSE
jgi:hypothetical protein